MGSEPRPALASYFTRNASWITAPSSAKHSSIKSERTGLTSSLKIRRRPALAWTATSSVGTE